MSLYSDSIIIKWSNGVLCLFVPFLSGHIDLFLNSFFQHLFLFLVSLRIRISLSNRDRSVKLILCKRQHYISGNSV